ncbi:DNA ligase [Marinomonas sp. IMCC 4694]|uniref:DNA ligase n=1 Tax=Marinomonas sp. IMCC 4694 TaxID=2605432 RepID=UPI0011E70875|nr:DNA ligase [Marinomonas sp. IMCC 4694]TYL47701.1 DNA ligase [Marinomonas sp. IMCC 4694]
MFIKSYHFAVCAFISTVVFSQSQVLSQVQSQSQSEGDPTPEGQIKPDVQLASLYSDGVQLSDYYISEKYDGVRAIWTGNVLMTRQGNPIQAPAWFTDPLPSVWLDGELWSKRNDFEFIVSTVRKHQPVDHEWRHIHYMVFDAPDQEKRMTFAQRYVRYSRIVTELKQPHVMPVTQFSMNDNAKLAALLARYVSEGSEGLMLHRKQALFESGRTDNLLKLKPHMDAEATVREIFNGAGKYEGMMGSVLVEMPSGIRFKIGSGFTDLQRQNPPDIGEIVTYKYHGFTEKGIPRFATFLRYRDPY